MLYLKSNIKKYTKEITWLLREKYNFSEIEISDFLFNGSPTSPSQGGRSTVHSPQLLLDLDRIFAKEPVDYIIGFKEFLGCKIDLSLKPLIPRPETEYWVQNCINELQSTVHRPLSTILDLCCGSGCIGIALLSKLSNIHITFADISENALEQTKVNLSRHVEYSETSISQETRNEKLEKSTFKNYEIIQSDLFKNLKGKKFDYIFCNPPYVPPQEIKGNLLHEPKLALDGKKDGLEIIYKILSEFQPYLKPNGKLFLEFGFGQKTKIESFLKTVHGKRFTGNVDFHKDQFNKYRLLVVGI